MSLSEKLMEELVSRTAFTISFGGIPVPGIGCVVTWGIMAFVILCYHLCEKFKACPHKKAGLH